MRFALTRGTGRFRAITGERAAPLCLALFVFAGYFKAADALRFVPVDLTLVFGALTALFCLAELWRERRLPPGTLPMLAVFATMAAGLHWPSDLGAYPEQKELRLYSLTALSAMAPLFLLRTGEDRLLFLYAIGFLGVAMSAAAAVEAIAAGGFSRANAFNTNPILLARASGFAALLLCTLYWLGLIRWWLLLPVAALALFGLLASGTRAPLLALVVAAALVAVLCSRQAAPRLRVLVTLVAGAVCLAGAVLYLDHARLAAGRRIARLFSGEWGDTEVTRWEVWGQTARVAAESPLGIGWGRLSEQVQVYHDDIILLRHPHNILLELAAEAGWPALIAFSILLGVVATRALRAAYEAAAIPDSRCPIRSLVVLGALSYWFVCAFFSGDVNDNRPLWAMLGLAWAAQCQRHLRRRGHAGNVGSSIGSERGPAPPQDGAARHLGPSRFRRPHRAQGGGRPLIVRL